ncbi:hypothetical protein FOZG_00804 [Fusarium oxysporum Fo47]|uniref:Uncharacterized protein n=1 Tax=Fusarium oxysporum Fo47 TaxID=660027 RepID=W9L058_FUSOX|nr:hypothetical protein FOZG_00804 [Fusarium oxysporum Fo47]
MDNAKNQPLSSFIPPRHSGQTPVNLTLPRANEAPKTKAASIADSLFACPWTTPTDTNNKLYQAPKRPLLSSHPLARTSPGTGSSNSASYAYLLFPDMT